MEILKTFENNTLKLNVYGTYDEPLFLGKEVGELLGLVNIRKNLATMADKMKRVEKSDTPISDGKRSGGQQNMTFITEAGLYTLIMRSNKPQAVAFQEWITEEVLPSIRKTGYYQMTNRTHRKNTIFHITDEKSLHIKVVDFIKSQYPDALISTGLGELQDTSPKRIESYQKGYLSGEPDLKINNLHKRFTGLVIEFKSPTGKGVLSDKQSSLLESYKLNGFDTMVSNDYDSILMKIVGYMNDIRIQCPHCIGRFRNVKTLANHKRYFHRII